MTLYAGLAGVDGIAHVALAWDDSSRNAVDFVPEAINVTLSLLRAAKRVPSVKRIALTSSSAAAMEPTIYTDKVLTCDDWNNASIYKYNRRNEEDCPNSHFYPAGKALSERAAWEFVEVEKVSPSPGS
jgi:nucleoside-diphosphate-sugar epimerase